MLKSMTGFGRCEVTKNDRKFTVELRGVNHRYLEVGIRIPKKFNYFESALRTGLKNYVSRGKVDIFVTYEDYVNNTSSVTYNAKLAKEYLDSINAIASDFGLSSEVSATMLSRYPEVLSLNEATENEDDVWAVLKEAFEGACEKFVESRVVEGTNLKNDIDDKLNKIEELVIFIDEKYPDIVNQYRERIYAKVKELLADNQIDQAVLATELTIFADKTCVDEETVRLRSHVNAMRQALNQGVGIGRKLDFIAQEMNREANTILSKANNIDVTNAAIDLKTEIEKVREQIQNIE